MDVHTKHRNRFTKVPMFLDTEAKRNFATHSDYHMRYKMNRTDKRFQGTCETMTRDMIDNFEFQTRSQEILRGRYEIAYLNTLQLLDSVGFQMSTV